MDKQMYNADSIKVLKGLTAVRKRPGMYIGNTDELSGLHHMLYEVVDNAIDEALAGHCKNITIGLYKDGSASVQDDGRGIPVGIHKEEGISAAEVIMTQLHAGGKFSQDIYKVSGGLHGVGVSVVNALSSRLDLAVYQRGKEYQLGFERGQTVKPLTEVGKTKQQGTYVRFTPDTEIFSVSHFDYKLLCNRFQELAFLNPGIKIKVVDYREEQPVEKIFMDTGGVESFARFLCGTKSRLNQHPLVITGKQNDIEVDCSIYWTMSYSENSVFFTNTIPQSDGGTHVAGLRAGLTKSFQNYVKEKGTKLQQKTEFVGDDIREGMICVLSVKVPDPKFSSQTKEKLVSSNVRQVVESLTSKIVESWLEENPTDANKVIQKIIDSANTREAARRARDLSRKGKSGNEMNLQMSKKLAACSEKDPEKCQLFIVEGDSAGGSAKQARNRFTQAVLPLRGKILNIEKVNFAKALSSEAISTLVAAIGTGIGDEFNIAKLRYHKIIIMTDADVDGKHISALLMTFFFRYMPQLIENGNIFIANPPLYGIVNKKHIDYIRDERDYMKYALNRGLKNLAFTAQNTSFSEGQLEEYCDEINRIRSMFPDKIMQQAISAKVIKNDLWHGDQINEQMYADALTKILAQILKTSNIKWYLKDNLLCSVEHGVTKVYTLKIQDLSHEKRDILDQFITKYGHMWGDGAKLNDQNMEDPFSFFDQVMAKGLRGLQIQRYKGLGEMPTLTLKEQVMEKEQTRLKLESIQEKIEEANQVCADLMGENVAARRQFIEENATYAELDS